MDKNIISPKTPSSKDAPKVLAIIVNWNKLKFVRNLLKTLENLEIKPDQIVVVDNASTDGSREMVREEFPSVRLVRNETNVGGSGGFNAGLRYGLEHGGFDYLWLLDNDVVAHQGALQALVEVAEADPKTGLVGSRIVELHRPERTQEVGARIHWPTGRLDKLGMLEKFPEPLTGRAKVFDADYAASCSLLARVEAIKEVGIWDSGYFVFFDDIEWGVRFTRAGWRVKATSDSVIEHESFHERRLLQGLGAIHLCFRNALFFMNLHCPRSRQPMLIFRMIYFALIEAAQYRLDGREERARCQKQAIADFFLKRRGKGAHTFVEDHLSQKRINDSDPIESQIPNRKGRILFWTVSGSPETSKVLERFRKDFPNHKIDVFVPEEQSEVDDFQADGLFRHSTQSRWKRLGLIRKVLTRYDAVARDERQSTYLFERLLPVAIWFSETADIGVTRNRWTHIAMPFLMRPILILQAAFLSARAFLTPRPKIDYFTWKGASKKR